MPFYHDDLDDKKIEERLKDLGEDQQQDIQKMYDIGEIINYQQQSLKNEIFNGNGKAKDKSDIIQDQNQNYVEYLIKSIKKTVKCEDALIRQILYTGLSTYIEDDPINLGVLAPTSEGKTYAIVESLQYFPDEDVIYIGQMSPKVLVRQKGILIDKKTGQPIGEKIHELRKEIRELVLMKKTTKDREEKANIEYEIGKIGEDIIKLIENSKTLIDLRGKILVFLEPPQYELWTLLKPILSHDKKEIEFPFVDKTAHSNAETKDVVLRGWPACIFCSAKDESKWEIWDEIKSRILTTSPNMVPQKYEESKKLISDSKGLPNLIQQQIIISDEEIERTKNCVLLIKQKINELKSSYKNRKISIWIPYHDLLDKALPANKGTDVRFAKKVFSLLNIISIVKSDLRMILSMEGENSIIADTDDLREVLSIIQNFDGLPKFKADFFNEIFYPSYAKKTEPDSNGKDKDDKGFKEEEIIAVTTRQLCDYFKEIRKQPISTDNLKNTYLNQLINEGIIDHTESKIHGRQNIYYPLVTDSSSLSSIMTSIDKDSQQTPITYEKITRNITEGWIFHEIIHLIRYRLDQTTIQLFNYFNDKSKFQILSSDFVSEEGEENKVGRSPLNLYDFVKKYFSIIGFPIDNKRSPDITLLAKRSPFLSILPKIDEPDKKDEKKVRDFMEVNHFEKAGLYEEHYNNNGGTTED